MLLNNWMVRPAQLAKTLFSHQVAKTPLLFAIVVKLLRWLAVDNGDVLSLCLNLWDPDTGEFCLHLCPSSVLHY